MYSFLPSSAPCLQQQMKTDVCQLAGVSSCSHLAGVPSCSQVAGVPSSNQLDGVPSSSQLAGVPSCSQLCPLPPEADAARCLPAAGVSGSGNLSPISH